MVTYTCNTCKKMFDRKSNYCFHINRKTPCTPNDVENYALDHETNDQSEQQTEQQINEQGQNQNKMNTTEREFICQYCDRSFTTNSNYHRHVNKYCKVKQNENIKKEYEKDEVVKRLVKQINILKRNDKQRINEINRLKSQLNNNRTSSTNMNHIKKNNHPNNITVNNTTINNANNIQNTNINTTINNNTNIQQLNQQNNYDIKILAYGKEDLSHIVDKRYRTILDKGFKAVQALTQEIHFNKNKPENQNVYISKWDGNDVHVFDGEKWKYENRDEILQQIIEDKSDILDKKFDQYQNVLCEDTERKYNRFKDQRDEQIVMKDIKKQIERLLYNEREMVVATKNNIKKSKI